MNGDGGHVGLSRDDPVLFDMDGVILKGRGTDPAVYAKAGEMALEALGIDPTVERRSVFRELVADESLVEACSDLGIDIEVFWSNKEQFASQLSHERMKDGPRGIYEDTEILGSLSDDWTLGLVSNNRQVTVEFVADFFEFDAVFSVIRGRDPTIAGFHRRKPEPYYLTETLESLNSESGIYIGDREKDYVAATRAGMSFSRIDRPSLEMQEDVRGAIASITSLIELPGVLSELPED
jgi:HAD superfamily hydrolase (TIGR01549 family)